MIMLAGGEPQESLPANPLPADQEQAGVAEPSPAELKSSYSREEQHRLKSSSIGSAWATPDRPRKPMQTDRFSDSRHSQWPEHALQRLGRRHDARQSACQLTEQRKKRACCPPETCNPPAIFVSARLRTSSDNRVSVHLFPVLLTPALFEAVCSREIKSPRKLQEPIAHCPYHLRPHDSFLSPALLSGFALWHRIDCSHHHSPHTHFHPLCYSDICVCTRSHRMSEMQNAREGRRRSRQCRGLIFLLTMLTTSHCRPSHHFLMTMISPCHPLEATSHFKRKRNWSNG